MKPTRIVSLLAVVGLLLATAVGQNPATYGTNAGRYGMTAWAINNQRVASQFNYYIDSSFQNGIGSSYSFPIGAITQALPLGGNKNVNPFNTNATVKIVDINSTLTETVALTSVTYSGSIATLALSATNAHTSYVLRSGTCGLREALNDLGGQGGEVIIDQKFYDDGCTAATITTSATIGGTLQANQYIHDISNGQDTWSWGANIAGSSTNHWASAYCDGTEPGPQQFRQ